MQTLDRELTQIKALIEQRDILKKELEDGYKSTLESFFIWCVQVGIAREGMTPEIVVHDYLNRAKVEENDSSIHWYR